MPAIKAFACIKLHNSVCSAHVFRVGLHNAWHNAAVRQSDFVVRFILFRPSSGTKLCFSYHLVYVQLTERAHLSRVSFARQSREKKFVTDDGNTNATEIYELNQKSKTD